ncbi:MAG: GlxA family transcriptional regulator [Paracoccus sp. (in: a-proteobacteria)]|uniref:GlxA family transcriptional regulator n=1 Tax=Paracoccus sp. TaxID=267 RepID=UPI0026E11271|nr:GlxA family transcriptional regulator [Paracoccus sp. (in: a-proteobacteria)]MDO5631464.1 GlxA family transcriptional regulator [Paracoccus sp. (in: a-proteobacteria)]
MNMEYVAKGVVHVPVRQDGPPARVVFLLLPRFSLLAFSAAHEVLRIANQLTARQLFEWQILSVDGGPVASSGGLIVQPTGTLDDLAPGAMVFVCGGVQPESAVSRKVSDWLRRQWRSGEVVGGLCTGAYALARAGLLAGRRFTLHWENIAPFRASHPGLEPVEQLYCMDGRIWTCAGGAAAADLFITMLRRRHGDRLADAVLSMSLHGHQRAGEQFQRRPLPPSLRPGDRFTAVMSDIEANLADITEVGDLAGRHGFSRRQVERLFRRHFSQSPREHLTALRLQRARALMTETGLSRAEIAQSCGFSSSSQMMRAMRRSTPQE